MKIAIFEDGWDDLIDRYSPISGKEFRLIIYYASGISLTTKYLNADLRLKGFENFTLKSGLPSNEEIPKADLYFLDGLRGDCFGLLEALPKKRSFVYTNNPVIRDELLSQGQRVLESYSDLEKVMDEFSSANEPTAKPTKERG